MVENDKDLKKEVQKLLQEVVVVEASSQVWKLFEKSLESLDTTQLSVLKEFFSGMTPDQIAKKWKLETEQVIQIVQHARASLLEKLRTQVRVRQ